MNPGQQHLHARKRIFKNLEPFPSTVPWKRALDYVMYAVGVVAPIALFPQVFEVYHSKSAAGLSLPTWIAFTCINALWATYALAHKDRQLFFASAAVSFFDFVIVIGVVLYH